MSHKHVYAIPAYGDSPYLESCIKSLEGAESGISCDHVHIHPKPVFWELWQKNMICPTTSGKEKAISGMTGTMLIPWQMQSLSLLPIRTICTAKTMGKNC